ncbi:MAG: biopolymer transporter ExbD [Fibrobacteres bacterium]|nr:biopolymer transporter ExbD [Fibrobacterota bacterium]
MAFLPSKRKEKAVSALIEAPDLDVTHVMNLLVILIPFLVSMAVFTQISSINFSLPPAASSDGAAGGEAPETDKLDISIAITSTGFTIAGTGQVMPPISKVNGVYDLTALDKILRAVKMSYPQQEDIILLVEQEVLYEDIVSVMDVCRDAQYPNIGLSGGIQ